ncbi:hypothetical protein SporoP33_00480 [Sporosarcina sp. P33]|nr:hypothetical protein SporoP33_00480 [Sporosarcina sp. P33]
MKNTAKNYKKSGMRRSATTDAGGPEAKNGFCLLTQDRSDPRGWRMQLDETKAECAVQPRQTLEGLKRKAVFAF